MIDERNLYRSMGKSEAPNAEPFQDWVSEEVLPSIRKTGSYGQQPQPQFDLTNLDLDAMIETLLAIQQLRKQGKARQLELETKLAAQTETCGQFLQAAGRGRGLGLHPGGRQGPEDATNELGRLHAQGGLINLRPNAR